MLVLTTFGMDEYVYGALRAGASGFLLKRTPPEQLVEAVHVVHAGEALLSPSVTARLVERFAAEPEAVQVRDLDELTDREREILVEVARGRSNVEIAEAFVVSVETVKTHIKRIFSKLGLRDRAQAVVVAYESGLVRPGR